MPSLFPIEISAQFFVGMIVIVTIIHLMLGICAYLVYAERKLCAYIQDRIGPNRVGPLGLLQPLADGLKFIVKEDFAPKGVDWALFTLAPCAIIVPALIGWAVIPWGGWIEIPDFSMLWGAINVTGGTVLVAAANVDIGIVFLLAVASLSVYGVTLGGWASFNKYSMLGGLRATAGMISYEIPMGLAILAVVLLIGNIRTDGLIETQAEHGWMIVYQPLAALLFFVCIMAEGNRAPFDNAEAEQELVGGYHTEYSSMRFALFFLAEYAHLTTASAFFALLFLGGYHVPFIGWTSPEAMGIGPVLLKTGVLLGKAIGAVIFMIILRWTLPRIRWDQVMKLCWNSLIPMGILIVIGTAVMVHMGWTGIVPMLLLNLGLTVFFLVVAPMLPKSNVNNRVPMAGSRFMPLEGEQVITGPRTQQAMRESSVPEGAADRPLASAT